MARWSEKIIFPVIASVLLAFTYCPASHAGGSGQDRSSKADMLMAELELSREQRDLIVDLKGSSRARGRELREELRASRNALREELKKPGIDRKAIEERARMIKDLQGRITDHRISSFLEIKQILTPEQFDKMVELREKKRRESGTPGRRK